MNREIKFRAWVESTLGDYMAIQGTPDLETLESFMYHYSDCKNLMQFTGLLDKNGREIYEGDINSYGYVIKYCEKKALFGEYGTRDKKNYDVLMSYPMNSIDMIILGNIYENPELLN